MIQLIKIKRTRKKPELGDVFVVQPREGLYFYGKVIKEVSGNIVDGLLVFLYKRYTEQLVMPAELDPDNLLMDPFIVTGYPWRSGHFYTVGNMGVTEEEDSLDCGFFHAGKTVTEYKDAQGNLLDHVPKIRIGYGIYTYYHVEIGIEKHMQETGLGGFRVKEVELVRLECSSKMPREGDVFVFQPHEGIYYYGWVMRTKLVSTGSSIKGKNLVYLYRIPSLSKEMPDRKDLTPENLLIAPRVVGKGPWSSGYFQTIGNYPVEEKDFSTDTGFRVRRTGAFVDVNGNSLDFEPRMTAPFAAWEPWEIASVVHGRIVKRGGGVQH